MDEIERYKEAVERRRNDRRIKNRRRLNNIQPAFITWDFIIQFLILLISGALFLFLAGCSQIKWILLGGD